MTFIPGGTQAHSNKDKRITDTYLKVKSLCIQIYILAQLATGNVPN